MKRRVFLIGTVLPLLLAAAGLFLVPGDTRAAGGPGALGAELRGNDSRQPIFRENYRNEIHFLLTAKRDRTRVFQEWCSWGYFTRWFTARIVAGPAKKYVFKRSKKKIWSKNYPASHAISEGEFLITNIDLCDGTWTVEPDLPPRDLELRLTGHLEISPDEETRKQKVWTGKLTAKPIVIIMGKSCAARLNKTGN